MGDDSSSAVSGTSSMTGRNGYLSQTPTPPATPAFLYGLELAPACLSPHTLLRAPPLGVHVMVHSLLVSVSVTVSSQLINVSQQ